jgi:hypothetical protein
VLIAGSASMTETHSTLSNRTAQVVIAVAPASLSVSPYGQQMSITQGTGGSTMVFNTVGQDAFWYSDITYPTGSGDAGIAAGDYTLNMYFSQLPSAGSSVDITVTVEHTSSDGQSATTITSASTTITSSTSDPLALDLGSGTAQTFSASDPRYLRVHIEVTGVSGGGSFTLAYDSSSDPSSLDTPVVTVPEWAGAFLLLVPLVPYLMSFIWKRRRRSAQIASIMLAAILAIGTLAGQVESVTAAPDTYYLHPTTTSGITPAGEYMNITAGGGGSTKAFNSAGQDAYWYVDQTWPTGNDNATIAAGNYTFNMYFANRPGAGSGDYPVVAATNTSATTTASTSHTVSLPTGISSGNLLIAMLSGYYGSGGTGVDISWPSGWTEFFEQDADSGTLHLAVAGAYRQADGTEGASITVTTNLSVLAAHNSYRITGAANPATQPPQAAAVSYTSAGNTIDPPSLTPTGGAKDYLWLAVAGWRRTGVNYSSGPTNYTNRIEGNSGGYANGTKLDSFMRSLNASSENPGAITLNSSTPEVRAGVTIAVHPAASVDIQVTVSHTAPDGSGATTIVTSPVTTIDSSTSDPYALSIGSGALQTFTSASPRRLRVQVHVVSVTSGGDFTLDYDGACGSGLCSNLDTPVVTVPEYDLAFVLPVLLIPVIAGEAWRRKRKSRGSKPERGE